MNSRTYISLIQKFCFAAACLQIFAPEFVQADCLETAINVLPRQSRMATEDVVAAIEQQSRRLGAEAQVISPPRSGGLDGLEQPKGLPG